MLRMQLLSVLLFSLCCSLLCSQDNGKLASGPKVGSVIPAPFESHNINGPAKDRPHCLVCQFALGPSVLIFAKEPADDKDAALSDLLKKLDEAAADFEDRGFSAGAVFVSPDARDSTNNMLEDSADLIKEKVVRDKLHDRLKKRAEPIKHVIIACMPEAPKKFNINPKADVTVLFYERMKVIDSWAFAPEGLQEKDVEAIVKRVRETVPVKKKQNQ